MGFGAWWERFKNSLFEPINKTIQPRLTVIEKVQTKNGFLSFEPASAETNLPSGIFGGLLREALVILERVERVGLQVRQALEMTSQLSRQRALAVAIEELQNLLRDEKLSSPEWFLLGNYRALHSAVLRWLYLLVEISAQEARVTPLTLENPYTAGNPVTGRRFFDREEILRLLRYRAMSGESFMLVGHRRSGKTSILMEFSEQPSPDWLPIYMTMERLAVAKDSGGLLYRIMQRIYEIMQRDGIMAPALVPREQFLENVAEGLESTLKTVLSALSPRRLVLCLDEYEMLEEGVQQSKYNRADVEYLVSGGLLRDTGSSIIVTGRASPGQLQAQFSQPIFAWLTPEWVDMLPESDARQLITNPVPDFPVNYEHEVVSQLYALTAGQPYLIQLICQTLIERLIEALTQHKDRDWTITMSDLESVLGGQHFEKGSFYYGQVWYEAGERGRTLLKRLATAEPEGMKTRDLLQSVNMADENGLATLRELTDQRILTYESQAQMYTFAIPLMYRWVKHTQVSELK